MKVFGFSFVIFWAFAIHTSSGVDDVEIASNGDLRSEHLSNEVVANAEIFELANDDAQSSKKLFGGIEKLGEAIEVGVPYGEQFERKGVSDVETEDKPMTAEEIERVFGIDIPMCSQYTNDRVPLHLSHLKDCGKFYKCYNGKAYLMDCPASEHWSVRLDRCDYPQQAKCVIDGTHQFKIKKVNAITASAQEKEEDEDKPEVGEFEIDPRCEGSDPYKPLHFKHPNDCSKFYKCYMGKAYVIKCPKGQHWAQTLNRCEHAQIAKCTVAVNLRPNPQRPGPRPAQAVDNFDSESYEEEHVHTLLDDADFMIVDPRCAPDEDDIYHPIQFAHPTDCTMFYKCYAHQAFKSACPYPLHYNDELEYCDYPNNAKCKALIRPAQAFESDENEREDEHTYAEDTDFIISDPRCIPDEDDIYHPIQFSHPTDCTMFYKCYEHNAVKSKCPPFLHFNEKRQYCDYPQLARCKYPISIMDASSTMYVSQIPSCPQTGTINFPVEDNFQNYFSCDNGLAYYKSCDRDEFFNPYMKKCEKVPHFMGPNQLPVINQMPVQNFPMFPMIEQLQNNIQVPQIPNFRPQEGPEFPSWMPIPNQNVQEIPIFSEKPSHEKPTNGFNYENGKQSSRCPSNEEPSKPTHLSHETDCQKFYKCFNGRAFLMECPVSQEWSDELQRCDYHQFANCDPVELIKKKIRN